MSDVVLDALLVVLPLGQHLVKESVGAGGSKRLVGRGTNYNARHAMDDPGGFVLHVDCVDEVEDTAFNVGNVLLVIKVKLVICVDGKVCFAQRLPTATAFCAPATVSNDLSTSTNKVTGVACLAGTVLIVNLHIILGVRHFLAIVVHANHFHHKRLVDGFFNASVELAMVVESGDLGTWAPLDSTAKHSRRSGWNLVHTAAILNHDLVAWRGDDGGRQLKVAAGPAVHGKATILTLLVPKLLTVVAGDVAPSVVVELLSALATAAAATPSARWNCHSGNKHQQDGNSRRKLHIGRGANASPKREMCLSMPLMDGQVQPPASKGKINTRARACPCASCSAGTGQSAAGYRVRLAVCRVCPRRDVRVCPRRCARE
eukprot:m.478602 g.478602  ORF g.478602 m.478602 type:complete len:373 (+) comp21172_c0_seq1:1911-3029(+)